VGDRGQASETDDQRQTAKDDPEGPRPALQPDHLHHERALLRAATLDVGRDQRKEALELLRRRATLTPRCFQEREEGVEEALGDLAQEVLFGREVVEADISQMAGPIPASGPYPTQKALGNAFLHGRRPPLGSSPGRRVFKPPNVPHSANRSAIRSELVHARIGRTS
jgi:hypothetical protein